MLKRLRKRLAFPEFTRHYKKFLIAQILETILLVLIDIYVIYIDVFSMQHGHLMHTW
jgi:hypothetical protein